jgi:hypothetical protein
MRELQALCLDVATYKLDVQQNTSLKEYEINLMSENSDSTSDFRPAVRISSQKQISEIFSNENL